MCCIIRHRSINKCHKYYFASSPHCFFFFFFCSTHLSIKFWPKLNLVPIIRFIDLFVIMGTQNLLQYLISAIWYYLITFPETCFSNSLNFFFFAPLHLLYIWFRLSLPTQDLRLLCAPELPLVPPRLQEGRTAFWSAEGMLSDSQSGSRTISNESDVDEESGRVNAWQWLQSRAIKVPPHR